MGNDQKNIGTLMESYWAVEHIEGVLKDCCGGFLMRSGFLMSLSNQKNQKVKNFKKQS